MDYTEVRRQWEERAGEYSPEYYAYYGADERSEAVCDALDRFVDRDATVLELGCSSGRHLSHLRENGFADLAGVEVNADAFDVMAETYPALADDGTFYCDAIEAVVGDFDDGQFDAVYSVETLQHLHPDVEWVFAELARITDDLLVTVENEGGDGSSAGSRGESDDAGRDEDDHDRPQENDPDVNYVTEDLPLYYRDWNRVFTDLGLTEVEARSGKRDTVRAFRTTDA